MKILRQFLPTFNPAAFYQTLQHIFPILVWLPNYKLHDLRYDIVAGITVGLTLVPQSIAYVLLGNLRPEVGLYSAFAGQFIYVLMGSSKDASIGPAAIVSMIMGNVGALANPLYEQGDSTHATILAFFAGVTLFVMGILKFGFVVNLFSIPVVSGFTTAAGITIATSQLIPLLGVTKLYTEMPGVFVKNIIHICENLHHVNLNDMTIGLSVAAFLLLMQYLPKLVLKVNSSYQTGCCWLADKRGHNRHIRPKAPSPGFETFLEVLRFVCACKNIIAFIVSTTIVFTMTKYYETNDVGISLVGSITPGLPQFSVPNFDIRQPGNVTVVNGTVVSSPDVVVKTVHSTLGSLTIGYIVTPLMIIMEMFAILKALGRKNGYRLDARQELMSVGLANILTSFLGGVPVTAAVTRAALNDQCHVRTQIGSIISASIVMIALQALSATFYYIPKATLAAIIIVAALNLVDICIIPDVWRHCRKDAILLVFTILICVFFEISYGVIICLSINALLLLRAVVNTQLHITHKYPDASFTFGDSEHPHFLTVVRLSHGMKYPSADKFLDKVARLLKKESHLIIDCTFVQSVDYTGVQAFRSLLLSALKNGQHLVFANMNDEVHREFEKLGVDHFRHVSSVETAIGEYNKAVVISEMEAASEAVDAGHSIANGVHRANVSTTELIPTVRVIDTTHHADETVIIEEGDERGDATMSEKDERLRRRLMRELSIQPHFYGDYALTIGGSLDYGSLEEGDLEDKAENFCDDIIETVSHCDRMHNTSPHSVHNGHHRANSDTKPRKKPETNIQFFNNVLLRQVSRNNSMRQTATSMAVIESLARRSELHNAVTAINNAPALEFIDIGSPERLSPVLHRHSHHQHKETET